MRQYHRKSSIIANVELQLVNGEKINIEPAFDSVETKLSNGSIQIASYGVKGEAVYTRGKFSTRLASAQLYDWLTGGWQSDHK